jgi:hypothetical protein
MKTQTILAIACLGLLLSVQPASAREIARAQIEYSVTVSVHEDVRPRLTKEDAEEILEGASKLLSHCNVRFKLMGPIQTFGSLPAVIRTRAQRNSVYGVDAHVKVVEEIKFCRPALGLDFFDGCAFPRIKGRKSMIVTHARADTTPLRSILWAHEFGHRTGLQHRADSDALMTSCPNLFGDQVQVNEDECRCFRLGPGGCIRPPVRPMCADGRR